MTKFKRTFFLLLVLLFTAAESQAISLGFSSTPLTVGEGKTFSVDVAVSGLGGMSLGGYDLDIGFDPALLSFKNVRYGDPLLSDQLASVDLEPITLTTAGSGLINLSEVSLEDPVILDLVQADSFVLATLFFQSFGRSTTSLWISDEKLTDSMGSTLDADIITRSVEIRSQPVPEPASCILMAVGLAGFAGNRLRRKRMRN